MNRVYVYGFRGTEEFFGRYWTGPGINGYIEMRTREGWTVRYGD